MRREDFPCLLLDIFLLLVKTDGASLFALSFLALASQQESSVLNNGVILDCGYNTWSAVNFKFILYLSAEELVVMTKVA